MNRDHVLGLLNYIVKQRGCGCCEGELEAALVDLADALGFEPVNIVVGGTLGEHTVLEGFE